MTGHHGGVEHVTIDFDDATLSKLNIDDKILIEGFGQGLKLTDYPDIKLFNIDPSFLHRMPIRKGAQGKLEVGVKVMVPAAHMGSGMGHNNMGTGDCDIMTHDAQTVKRLGLEGAPDLSFSSVPADAEKSRKIGLLVNEGKGESYD